MQCGASRIFVSESSIFIALMLTHFLNFLLFAAGKLPSFWVHADSPKQNVWYCLCGNICNNTKVGIQCISVAFEWKISYLKYS